MKYTFFFFPLLIVFHVHAQVSADAMDTLDVKWEKQLMVSKSTPTLQVVVNPMLRKGSPIHDQSFEALKKMGCDYVRYVPWLPYPKLVVAELEPPGKNKTYWDFNLIDPMTIDFLNATKGHSVILNFSTIPAWMYKTEKPVEYPENPDSVIWNYTQGLVPRDTTLKEMADYFARVYSWYTKGGFTDELEKYHESGYHFDVPYWEVLNEPDFEHNNTPQQYTRQYDAIVSAIKKESPNTKFVGLALAFENTPEFFEYFLNPKNHKAGIPLDMISYHFYATASMEQDINIMQYTFFDRADGFLNTVRYIESIRKRLSPATQTTTDEIGSILSSDFAPKEVPIPDEYWNLSAATYAYVFLDLIHQGIDVIGESQLVGYPSQFPSVSMMNWKNGKPNARYWTLKLIKDNFSKGDTLVDANVFGKGLSGSALSFQAFNTKHGKKVLLINKRNVTLHLALPANFRGGTLYAADVSSGDNEPSASMIGINAIELKPFAVAVITAK
ncbi:MAG: glycosyl hydrolase family 39 [Chitinophagales bacterium]